MTLFQGFYFPFCRDLFWFCSYYDFQSISSYSTKCTEDFYWYKTLRLLPPLSDKGDDSFLALTAAISLQRDTADGIRDERDS